ncbi:hypothetical protein SARC_04939 [Sphaeroforma arctica JP610]|uniref:Helicase ATP-binding domain-containing protein n=1 Tax=Sphaeroforma arctica JP610 TaxID=667725 RepID=A0A0L0G1S5_9EUKA|nr:hypothetical protein SARC_04939 [Sphaeroforma arctica JP610]KNC82781.1 hypothetical protein SARC_04939 [Sphaeroforma arctica JP610]|eukprot:XP_014156683.1 hypothetical protein SARC_04939 [Sphaeroforma arctica JP610]
MTVDYIVISSGVEDSLQEDAAEFSAEDSDLADFVFQEDEFDAIDYDIPQQPNSLLPPHIWSLFRDRSKRDTFLTQALQYVRGLGGTPGTSGDKDYHLWHTQPEMMHQLLLAHRCVPLQNTTLLDTFGEIWQNDVTVCRACCDEYHDSKEFWYNEFRKSENLASISFKNTYDQMDTTRLCSAFNEYVRVKETSKWVPIYEVLAHPELLDTSDLLNDSFAAMIQVYEEQNVTLYVPGYIVGKGILLIHQNDIVRNWAGSQYRISKMTAEEFETFEPVFSRVYLGKLQAINDNRVKPETDDRRRNNRRFFCGLREVLKGFDEGVAQCRAFDSIAHELVDHIISQLAVDCGYLLEVINCFHILTNLLQHKVWYYSTLALGDILDGLFQNSSYLQLLKTLGTRGSPPMLVIKWMVPMCLWYCQWLKQFSNKISPATGKLFNRLVLLNSDSTYPDDVRVLMNELVISIVEVFYTDNKQNFILSAADIWVARMVHGMQQHNAQSKEGLEKDTVSQQYWRKCVTVLLYVLEKDMENYIANDIQDRYVVCSKLWSVIAESKLEDLPTDVMLYILISLSRGQLTNVDRNQSTPNQRAQRALDCFTKTLQSVLTKISDETDRDCMKQLFTGSTGNIDENNSGYNTQSVLDAILVHFCWGSKEIRALAVKCFVRFSEVFSYLDVHGYIQTFFFNGASKVYLDQHALWMPHIIAELGMITDDSVRRSVLGMIFRTYDTLNTLDYHFDDDMLNLQRKVKAQLIKMDDDEEEEEEEEEEEGETDADPWESGTRQRAKAYTVRSGSSSPTTTSASDVAPLPAPITLPKILKTKKISKYDVYKTSNGSTATRKAPAKKKNKNFLDVLRKKSNAKNKNSALGTTNARDALGSHRMFGTSGFQAAARRSTKHAQPSLLSRFADFGESEDNKMPKATSASARLKEQGLKQPTVTAPTPPTIPDLTFSKGAPTKLGSFGGSFSGKPQEDRLAKALATWSRKGAKVTVVELPSTPKFVQKERPAMVTKPESTLVIVDLFKQVLMWHLRKADKDDSLTQLVVKDDKPKDVIPLAFDDYAHYRRIFTPFLIVEFADSLRNESDFGSERIFGNDGFCLGDIRKDGEFWLLRFAPSQAIIDCEYGVDDVVVISRPPKTNADGTAASPEIDRTSGVPPHLLGLVQETPRWKSDKDKFLVIKLHYNAEMEKTFRVGTLTGNFRINQDYHVSKLANIRPIIRQYQALVNCGNSPLINCVIKPKLPAMALRGDAIAHEATSHLANRRHQQYNRPQLQAIRNSIAYDGITMIQGPPGTGKTRTILGLLAAFFKQPYLPHKPRVLLCAPSNAAVDEVVRRILDVGLDMGTDIKHPVIVRVGDERKMDERVMSRSWNTLAKVPLDALKKKLEALNELQKEKGKLHSDAKRLTNERLSYLKENGTSGHQSDTQWIALSKAQQDAKTTYITAKTAREKMYRNMGRLREQEKVTILEGAEIIATTLNGSGNDAYVRAHIDIGFTVIDEAAQSTELDVLIALQHNGRKCVMVGDPNQLPATVQSKISKELGYERSMFRRMQVYFLQQSENKHSPVELLTVQYRMHPEIASFPSKQFYEGQLTNHSSTHTGRPVYQKVFGPYMFANVDGIEQNVHGSYINEEEANDTLALFVWVCMSCRGTGFSGRVGIVTPYSAQKHLIRRLFCDFFGGEAILSHVEIDSVDSYQGREKDIIIFSCVRANHSGNIGFLNDVRRLNVALTRAKHCMWVLGNAELLSKDKEKSIFKDLADDARDRVLMKNGRPWSEYSRKHPAPSNAMLEDSEIDLKAQAAIAGYRALSSGGSNKSLSAVRDTHLPGTRNRHSRSSGGGCSSRDSTPSPEVRDARPLDNRETSRRGNSGGSSSREARESSSENRIRSTKRPGTEVADNTHDRKRTKRTSIENRDKDCSRNAPRHSIETRNSTDGTIIHLPKDAAQARVEEGEIDGEHHRGPVRKKSECTRSPKRQRSSRDMERWEDSNGRESRGSKERRPSRDSRIGRTASRGGEGYRGFSETRSRDLRRDKTIVQDSKGHYNEELRNENGRTSRVDRSSRDYAYDTNRRRTQTVEECRESRDGGGSLDGDSDYRHRRRSGS